MKINHRRLDELYRAYAVATFPIDGKPAIFVASEEKGYPCYMYTGERFEKRTVVWESYGGCMSIVPIPNVDNQFLAIIDFDLKESPSKAKLVWGKYCDGQWSLKDVFHLPYLHRFDLYHIDGVNYFIGATIADEKEFKDDWSHSGSIYKGILPDIPSEGFCLEKIAEGLYRNHGYYRVDENEKIKGYFSSDEGVFELDPQKDWSIRQILHGPVGEIALSDINGDGKLEMITIEPFHGSQINIYEYKKESLKKVYSLPLEVEFGHTLVGDTLSGIPSFIGGMRREGNQLFVVQYSNDNYVVKILDNGGPANLAVGHLEGFDYIVSANHSRNEAAVYFIEK